jgi:hypothetical protein
MYTTLILQYGKGSLEVVYLTYNAVCIHTYKKNFLRMAKGGCSDIFGREAALHTWE